METNYEVGKTYDLTFAGVITKDNDEYIVATDGNRDYTLKPYDYQIEYSLFPRTISCYVRKVGFTGNPYFEQSREQILEDRYYQTGITHEFVIHDVLMDSNTQSVFYILLDEFGIQHRYYPEDEETVKKAGDKITLLIRGIIPSRDGKNNARLDLGLQDTTAKASVSFTKPSYPKNQGKKNFGCENEKKEFKSSIVFPAGQTGPNIGQQLGIICRTIAGFMNANGGTLYIGVSDNGYICGIENDYDHLNDVDEDMFTYKANDDGYLQKITNSICKILGRTAGTLISMSIEEEDDKKYCVINIKKASRPIWFNGNKLFVRMVTTNRKLEGDEISQFVLDRVSKASFAKQKEAEVPAPDTSDEAAAQSVVSAVPPATTATAQISTITPLTTKRATANKPWRHITLYNNGEWSFQKDELQGDDVICNAIVPKDAKQNNLILILAYENGCVDAVYLKKVLYGKNGLLPEGKRRGGGICLANGPLAGTFCVNKKDMLLLTSDIAGESFVKALDIDALRIHDKMGKGKAIVREKGAKLISAIHILNDDGTRVSLKGSGIFIEKNQTYTKGGVKLNSLASNYRSMIDQLSGK